MTGPVTRPGSVTPAAGVAALFVDAAGIYRDLGLDVWCKARDARQYVGDLPVVAHPPCERWGWYARQFVPRLVGQDDGCFKAALAAVTRAGGVIEHPESSSAWTAFNLQRPGGWGWTGGGLTDDGLAIWSCAVDQGHFGHAAPKRTWLYLVTSTWIGSPPPELPWNPSAVRGRIHAMSTKRQREATPEPFARLLIALASGDLRALRDLVQVTRAGVTAPGCDLAAGDLPGRDLTRCEVCGDQIRSHRRRLCSPRCRQRASRQRRVVTRARFAIDGVTP